MGADLRASLKEVTQRRVCHRLCDVEVSGRHSPRCTSSAKPEHQPWCVLLDDECDCYWV